MKQLLQILVIMIINLIKSKPLLSKKIYDQFNEALKRKK
jgi:uncharacterized protein YxeA